MPMIQIDTQAVQAIPSSLMAWTATKGPRTLVAELQLPHRVSTNVDCYSLKGWTKQMGPRAMVAQLIG